MIWIDGKEVEVKKFPNGESLIEESRLKYAKEHSEITFKYEGDADLIHLMFIRKALKHINKLVLIFTYMPYSRMDRHDGGMLFTLKYVTDFINSLDFDRIIIVEPHSEVCVALLEAEDISPMKDMFKMASNENGYCILKDYVCFPDATASKRYSKQFSECGQITGNKVRDFETGRIKALELSGAPKSSTGFDVYIIDDISSYGGTFILTAEKLKELGAKNIYLLVAHAEESIYKGKIFESDLIKKVYTTNSIITEEKNEKIKIIRELN